EKDEDVPAKEHGGCDREARVRAVGERKEISHRAAICHPQAAGCERNRLGSVTQLRRRPVVPLANHEWRSSRTRDGRHSPMPLLAMRRGREKLAGQNHLRSVSGAYLPFVPYAGSIASCAYRPPVA